VTRGSRFEATALPFSEESAGLRRGAGGKAVQVTRRPAPPAMPQVINAISNGALQLTLSESTVMSLNPSI
jgi:hypothetical protein